jgi:hypothetical protein
MAYSARISRANPGCVLFLIDQSGSMSLGYEGTSLSKADYVADVLNKTLQNLILRSAREDGIRDYFDVGVIGYGDDGARSALGGSLANSLMHPISDLEKYPLRLETRQQRVPDGAGGLVTLDVKFPVWFESRASGSTPMCEALVQSAAVLVDWCDQHSKSFPPVVIHLSDGEATDGDPESITEQIRQIRTEDGPIVFMNIFVSGNSSLRTAFPSEEASLPSEMAKRMFRMSSLLSGNIAEAAAIKGYSITNASRAFIFDACPTDIVDFFEIGTTFASLALPSGMQ